VGSANPKGPVLAAKKIPAVIAANLARSVAVFALTSLVRRMMSAKETVASITAIWTQISVSKGLHRVPFAPESLIAMASYVSTTDAKVAARIPNAAPPENAIPVLESVRLARPTLIVSLAFAIQKLENASHARRIPIATRAVVIKAYVLLAPKTASATQVVVTHLVRKVYALPVRQTQIVLHSFVSKMCV
jgi:hypothetical protein